MIHGIGVLNAEIHLVGDGEFTAQKSGIQHTHLRGDIPCGDIEHGLFQQIRGPIIETHHIKERAVHLAGQILESQDHSVIHVDLQAASQFFPKDDFVRLACAQEGAGCDRAGGLEYGLLCLRIHP